MGLTEISTGLGYMVGPPLGGMLFAAGGFATPFVVLGLALLPAAPPLAPTLGPVFPELCPSLVCRRRRSSTIGCPRMTEGDRATTRAASR